MSGVDEHVVRVVDLIARQPTTAEDGAGVMAYLRRLCRAAAASLSASGVGVSLMDEGVERGVAVASDPATEYIDDLQLLLGEGPAVDSFLARRPVLVADLADGAVRRWPMYAPTLTEAGVRAVFAFPMQIGAARLGVLKVFRARPGHLTASELSGALSFAEVAVRCLLDGQESAPGNTVAEGLDGAVERRAVLFQAQGMVMVQLGVGITEAMVRIRAHAYAMGRDLSDVAADIVARRLRFDQDREDSR